MSTRRSGLLVLGAVLGGALGGGAAFFAGTLVSAMTEPGAFFGSGGEGAAALVTVLAAIASAVTAGAGFATRALTRRLGSRRGWWAAVGVMTGAAVLGAVLARL